jgi:hypothetical protein
MVVKLEAKSRTPTTEEIERARTPAGGWTRAQLAAWGVPWPPPKGWRKELERRAEIEKIVRRFAPALRRLAKR